MTILKRSLLGSLALAALFVPTAFASAATATIQNLSAVSPLAKTNVTFSVAVAGFNSPYYSVTDTFPNSTINSTNINFGGNFQWVPIVSDIGTHTITVKVTDSDGNLSTATQSITVLPPPSISIQSVSPGTTMMPGAPFTFNISAPGFVNPTFVASDSFSGSTVGNTSINSSGNFSWTPDATQNGEHAITIYATDASGHNASATQLVRVGAGPTLTVPSNVNLNVSPGQVLTFTLTPAGYSPNGFSVRDKFTGSTLNNSNINTSGLLTWIPAAGDAGAHVVTLMGQVGVYGQTASTSVTINVLGPNGVVLATPTTTATTIVPTNTKSAGLGDLQKQLSLLQSQSVSTSKTVMTTSSGSSYIFSMYLKQGMENDEVMELQKVLTKLGYLKVHPNGFFGPSTVAAVKRFQAAHKLDQLGAVGAGTRLELNSLADAQTITTSTQTTATVSGSSYTFEHFMGVGDDDADVLELQKRLSSLGFLTTAPTGYFGAGTEAAVKKYQTKHGIASTGYVAKNTRTELNK